MILNLPTKIDFGQMKFGSSYSRDYIIKNTTNQGINITDFSKSCSCVQASLKVSHLSPNESTTINVTVTPGSTGLFSRSMAFKINGQSYTVTLTGHAS
jgi:hypothetical protein